MFRPRNIAIAVIPFALLAGYLIWRAFPRDRASPVAVGDAVRAFRRRAVGPLAARPGEPAPGVYRYSTRGVESVDTAFGMLDASHRFHGLSTISVIPTRCGLVERWQALASRWTEVASCRGARGHRLLSVEEMHEFFGVGRDVLYRCREPVRPGAAVEDAGMGWSGHCETADGSSSRESRFRVLGLEPVRVGRRRFEAVHSRTDLRLLGDYSGSASMEDWRRRSDGLLLRRVASTDAKSNGTPDAGYTERYEIRIRSLTPDR